VTARGTLNILQPNISLCLSRIFRRLHARLGLFAQSASPTPRGNGYEVIDVKPRFLPLTVKSRLPVSPFLIGLYLKSAFKPMGQANATPRTDAHGLSRCRASKG
jgi:hypothetical protein